MSSLTQVIESIKSEIKVDSKGKGFISIRGLARLVDTGDSNLSTYISGAMEAPKKMLERLNSVGFEGAMEAWSQTGIPDIACSAFILYYALDAREYKGQQQAKNVLSAYVAIGIRSWLQNATGYQPPAKQINDSDTLEALKMAERVATRTKDMKTLKDVGERLRNYLDQIGVIANPESLYPVATLEKDKIFTDLVRACKSEAKKVSYFRTHSLCRRRDVLKAYGDRYTKKYLLKDGILLLFIDAAKHGYGSFDKLQNTFKPTQASN